MTRSVSSEMLWFSTEDSSLLNVYDWQLVSSSLKVWQKVHFIYNHTQIEQYSNYQQY